MPNDDLGTFPMPPQTTPAPVDPVVPVQSPVTPVPPTFEETPSEIPSMQTTPPSLETEQEKLVTANEDLIQKQTPPVITPPQPMSQPEQEPAVIPPKTGGSLAPIIIVVLLIVAGVGLAAAAFLSAQTNKLKAQLSEITQTLEQQQTTLTPTATPSVFEIPTPTMTPVSTISAAPSPIPQTIDSLFPLKNAPSALKIAINHSPNAQLILIKVDNATDPISAVTKYFFREDLTTKKYFYVAVTGTGTPEIVDKQIYVTPDDNIPSLNDAVLSDKMGIELDEAVKIAYAQCVNQTACTAAPIKAQYIKTGTGIIWQLSLYTNGLSGTPLMIQINALTKVILYKSPEFANK